jgi:hypothetical protein
MITLPCNEHLQQPLSQQGYDYQENGQRRYLSARQSNNIGVIKQCLLPVDRFKLLDSKSVQ